MADESKKDVATYFYTGGAAGAAQQGPVAQDKLVQLAKSGQLGAGTVVWTEAMPIRVAAYKLPFLAPHLKRPAATRTHTIVVGGTVAAIGILLLSFFLWMVPSAAARESASACRGLGGFNKVTPALCRGDEACPLPVAAPDFEAIDHQGQKVRLSDFRGKVVLLNFWASWCNVCKTEKPGLAELASELGSSQFEVISLASDRDWTKVLIATIQALAPNARMPRARDGEIQFSDAFAAYKEALPDGVPFKVFLDPPRGDDNMGPITKSWGMKAVPESALIDRHGNIRAYFVNKRDWSSAVAQTCIRAVIDE